MFKDLLRLVDILCCNAGLYRRNFIFPNANSALFIYWYLTLSFLPHQLLPPSSFCLLTQLKKIKLDIQGVSLNELYNGGHRMIHIQQGCIALNRLVVRQQCRCSRNDAWTIILDKKVFLLLSEQLSRERACICGVSSRFCPGHPQEKLQMTLHFPIAA